MIDQLVSALRELRAECTGREIAELLWLARIYERAAVLVAPPPNPESATEVRQPPARQFNDHGSSTRGEKPVISRPSLPQRAPETAVADGLARVFLPAPAKSKDPGAVGGVPLRAPSAGALPRAKDIARALRPLRRRVPSRHSLVIDEEATARRVGELKQWFPVFRPAKARWLDLALVIDGAASMSIWESTVTELTALLRQQGAFRDVRSWVLETETHDTGLLLRTTSDSRQKLNARELVDPTRRRLIFVLTDGMAAAWWDGRVGSLLTAWGCHAPTVVVSVLPKSLQFGTALGDAPRATVRSIAPGSTSRELIVVSPSRAGTKPAGLTTPIATLDPHALGAIAALIVGKGNARAPAIFIDPKPSLIEGDAEPVEAWSGTGVERVQQFDRIASPTAQLLARLLAAAPISLPVVHLIRRTMLPKATQDHVAEVFLGGLLEEVVDPDGPRLPADRREYDFHDGVRNELQRSLRGSESLAVLHHVSRFVETRLGHGIDFPALLENRAAPSGWTTNPAARPFAQVAATVLKRLGGKFAEAGARLTDGVAGRLSRVTVLFPEDLEFRSATIHSVERESSTTLTRATSSIVLAVGAYRLVIDDTSFLFSVEGSDACVDVARLVPQFRDCWVLVAGTGHAHLSSEEQTAAEALGEALGRRGCGLVTGGWPGVDHQVARSYADCLHHLGQGDAEIAKRVQHVLSAPGQFMVGRLNAVPNGLEEYWTAVEIAQAVVLIGGEEGTAHVAQVAEMLGRRIFSVPGTGGVGEGWPGSLVPGSAELGVGGAVRQLVAVLNQHLGERSRALEWIPAECLSLVARYLRPIPLDEANSVITELWELWHATAPADNSVELLSSLVASPSPTERVLGYIAAQQRPAIEVLRPLLLEPPRELDHVKRYRETRPLWQALVALKNLHQKGPATTSWSLQDVALIAGFLEKASDLLTKHSDVDTGGECKHLLHTLRGMFDPWSRLAAGAQELQASGKEVPRLTSLLGRCSSLTMLLDEALSELESYTRSAENRIFLVPPSFAEPMVAAQATIASSTSVEPIDWQKAAAGTHQVNRGATSLLTVPIVSQEHTVLGFLHSTVDRETAAEALNGATQLASALSRLLARFPLSGDPRDFPLVCRCPGSMELLRLVGVSPNIDSPGVHPLVVGLLGPYPDPTLIPKGLVLNTVAWESNEAADEGDYVITVAEAVRLVARHTEFRLAPTRTTTKSFEAACMALLQSGVDILLVTYGPATAESQDGMRRVVEAANASGTIVVWSAANDPQAGERVPQQIADDFLFVSSVDFSGARAKFSSEVSSSVWAPGVEIVLAMQGRLQSRSGNTYSAAIAAGLVARTLQAGVPLPNVVSYLRQHGEARNGGPPVLNLAQALESFNAPDKNGKLSSRAILERLREFGDRYQVVRRTMKGGSSRTAVMNETVNDIARWATSAGVVESHLKTILRSGKDGERLAVLACCVSVPDQAPVSALRRALDRPASPFEQWTALLAARSWLEWVELGEADPLLTGILKALDTPANIINDERDESRKALAESVLIEFSRRIGFVWTWLDAQARRELDLWLELGSERQPEHGCVAIWGSDHAGHHRDLAVALGRRLTSHGWRVVTGLGPNVGAAIFEGARLEGFEDSVTIYSDRDSGEAAASVQVCSSLEGARQRILEHASCAIVIAGASGTRHEYELAAGSRLTVLPVPFTGGTAAAVAEQALSPMKAIEPALIGLLDLPNGDAAERITRVLNFATRNRARASVDIVFDSYCLRRDEDSETYDWCVFIASPKELVQSVQSVDYTLHPTFRVREVSVTETQNRFCLVSSGWGSFTLGIKINFKDGTRQMASYLLRLRSSQWPLAARSTFPAGSPEALMLSVMEDASKHRWRKTSTLAKKARLGEEEALERLQKLQQLGACRPANFDIGGEQTLWGATSVVGLLPSL